MLILSPPPPSLGTGSPRRHRQRKTLEQQTALSPPQVSGSSQSGLDSVSLQSASSGGSGRENVEEKGLTSDGNVVIKELNGDVRNNLPVSHSYSETLNDEVGLLFFTMYVHDLFGVLDYEVKFVLIVRNVCTKMLTFGFY